jgi:hypothetical protein
LNAFFLTAFMCQSIRPGQKPGKVIETNSEQGVTWVHSYVSADKTRTFCVYDAPSAEAIRQVAERNHLPVTGITEVSVLAPYFYH